MQRSPCNPAMVVPETLGYAGASSIAQAARRIEQDMTRVATRLGRLERQLAND